MPFDGSGNFNRTFPSGGWQGDAAANIKIKADRHDQHDADLASGLSNAICRDGQSVITANIPFNAKKITNLAAGTDPTDAINLGQLTAFRTFPTGIVISGSGANGMVNFTGATAPTGLSFTANDTAWIARSAGTPANMPNRLVLNDKADGSGTDVFFISDSGRLTTMSAHYGSNIYYDGANYRVVNAGWGGVLSLNSTNGDFAYFTHTATAAAGAVVTLISPFSVTRDGTLNCTIVTAGIHMKAFAYCGNGDGIFASNTGTAAGTIYLRPNGINASAGQTVVSPDGGMSCANTFYASARITSNSGYQCRAGTPGGFYGNTFNFGWTTGCQLWIDNVNCGTITVTSDYRIKKDVADLASTWEQVKALRPIKYTQAEFQPPMSDETKAKMLQNAIEQYAAENGIEVDEVDPQDVPEAKPAAEPLFKADDIERWGFIAHELQETLVHSAAEGEKDMPDGVQSLNLASILAATVKALQEAMTRIEALEAA